MASLPLYEIIVIAVEAGEELADCAMAKMGLIAVATSIKSEIIFFCLLYLTHYTPDIFRKE